MSVKQTSPSNVLSGGKVTVSYQVTAGGGLGGGGDQNGDSITVKFNLPSGVQCGDCGQQVTLQANQSQNFSAHLTMPQVGAGQSQNFTVSITATSGNDQSAPASTQITVQGPDKPQSVRAITGRVKDTGGKGVSGARVAAQDSAGHTFQALSSSSGAFSILSNDANPIAPGNIHVGAGKDGFGDGAVVTVQGTAGKTVNVNLTLKPLVVSSASASASATPSTSSNASLDPGSVLDTDAPAGPVINRQSDEATKKASNDSGSGSTLFVVLGALLVAAGIGAIVLVLMRRRNATKGDGPDGTDPTVLGGGPGVVPPSQGRFADATRVGGAPVGGFGGPAAATMVAPRSGAPSMSDAPTMLHRPVPAAEDEFPDPYGVPLPQPGSYAGTPAGGWDDQAAANQYGGAPAQYGQGGDDYAAGTGQYGGAPANGQYGAGAGQYAGGAPQQRFDEHTSLYQPESEQDGYGGYDQGGYGANGAAGGGQYGANGAGTGTYGGGAPAGAAPGAGEYGAGAGGQYGGGAYGAGQEDDYRAGGYQAGGGGGGYGQEPAEQGGYGSWGAPAGGIDSGNGYGPQGGAQGAPSAPAAPGGGQYGGGAYGGAGAANGGGTYGAGQYGGAAGGGYDDRAGYDQGYDQQQPGPGGAYGAGAGGEYGRGNGAVPPQPGTPGYDQYEEDKNGYGGRRGYEDDPQQPTPRRGGGGGGGRRPGGY